MTALEMLRALQKMVKRCHRECECADNLQLAIAKLEAEQAKAPCNLDDEAFLKAKLKELAELRRQCQRLAEGTK